MEIVRMIKSDENSYIEKNQINIEKTQFLISILGCQKHWI